MVQAWWAAGIAVPALVINKIVSGRGKPRKEESRRSARADDGTDSSFVCERVCTSDRLLRRMGDLSKDPTPNTCVTVCGVSGTDACTDACRRTVCLNLHQVPAWNESCLTRCTTECIRGRTGS